MALRDQPYFPLYVQDYLTDEKLNSCTAATQGVYIKILCILHKIEPYGKLLLKQKDKQTDKQILNFALKFAKLLPFDSNTIHNALSELIDEGVMILDGDCLFQKRMVRDGELSETRSNAAKSGGGNPLFKQNHKQTIQQKDKQNPEYENEDENEDEDENENEDENEDEIKGKKIAEIFEEFREAYPGVKRGHETEFENLKKHKDWRNVLPKLKQELQRQYFAREQNQKAGQFVPDWKHWKTYINQRGWEEEININNQTPKTNGTGSKVSDSSEYYKRTVAAADQIIEQLSRERRNAGSNEVRKGI